MPLRPLSCLMALLAATLPAIAQPARDARVPDTAAQRALACTACHRLTDVPTREGYIPRIAGKPAGYLHEQLQAFRDGRRRNDAMARLLENQSEASMRALAAHFADQHAPYPPPAAAPAGAAAQRGAAWVRQGDAARGVPACVRCHGEALTGIAPMVPGLVGLPAGYLTAQLGAWRSGVRQGRAPDCMAQIARRLPADAVSEIAQWLAAQPVPVPATPAASAPPAPWPPMDCGILAK
ncbi:c-type cytochrome [Aquabacterium humicola]|uniref:c-type cytochrome n=1 Tax=Aquabacterium humicola TaxID=3237377 RepID=UPI002542E131|nr:cytochrome c4 [Rubrivivax pictus]